MKAKGATWSLRVHQKEGQCQPEKPAIFWRLFMVFQTLGTALTSVVGENNPWALEGSELPRLCPMGSIEQCHQPDFIQPWGTQCKSPVLTMVCCCIFCLGHQDAIRTLNPFLILCLTELWCFLWVLVSESHPAFYREIILDPNTLPTPTIHKEASLNQPVYMFRPQL